MSQSPGAPNVNKKEGSDPIPLPPSSDLLSRDIQGTPRNDVFDGSKLIEACKGVFPEQDEISGKGGNDIVFAVNPLFTLTDISGNETYNLAGITIPGCSASKVRITDESGDNTLNVVGNVDVSATLGGGVQRVNLGSADDKVEVVSGRFSGNLGGGNNELSLPEVVSGELRGNTVTFSGSGTTTVENFNTILPDGDKNLKGLDILVLPPEAVVRSANGDTAFVVPTGKGSIVVEDVKDICEFQSGNFAPLPPGVENARKNCKQ